MDRARLALIPVKQGGVRRTVINNRNIDAGDVIQLLDHSFRPSQLIEVVYED